MNAILEKIKKYNYPIFFEKLIAKTDLSNLSDEGEAHFDNKFVKKAGDTIYGPLIIDTIPDKRLNKMVIGGTPLNDNWSDTGLLVINGDVNLDETHNNANTVGFRIGALDQNSIWWSIVQSLFLENETMQTELLCRRKINGRDVIGNMGIGIDKNGNFLTYAPTPNINSNDANIATTAWIRNQLNTSGGALGSWNKALNGFIKFSNGIILQWGNALFSSSGTTITFLTPFSTTNYKLSYAPNSGAEHYAVGAATTAKTPTSFTAHGWTRDRINDWNCDWLAIGF